MCRNLLDVSCDGVDYRALSAIIGLDIAWLSAEICYIESKLGGRISFFDPSFRNLMNLILDIPLCLLSFTTYHNLLDLDCDGVDYQALFTIIGWTLRGIVPRFVTLNADYGGGFATFPLFGLRRQRL